MAAPAAAAAAAAAAVSQAWAAAGGRPGAAEGAPPPRAPPPRALPAPRSGRWDAERRDSQTPAARRKDARGAALGRAGPPRSRQ